MLANRKHPILAILLLLGAGVCWLLTPSAIAAQQAASAPACGSSLAALLGGGSPATAELPGSPDATLISSFALLRRPAGTADAVPALNPFYEDLRYELASYYPGYVRQLAQLPDGRRFFLIPGFIRLFSIPPARCLSLSQKRLRKRLVEEQLKRARETVYCVEELAAEPPPSLGLSTCQPFADISTGARLVATDTSASLVVDLVPDGVATVRLSYRDGTTIVASASGNAFMFTPPQALIRRVKAQLKPVQPPRPNSRPTKREIQRFLKSLIRAVERVFAELAPSRVQWLDVNGNLLRSFVPRSSEATGLGINDALISAG